MSVTIVPAVPYLRPRPVRVARLTFRRLGLRTADGRWSWRAGLFGELALILALSAFCVGWYGYAVAQRDAWQQAELATMAPQLEQQCALPGLADALLEGGKMYASVDVHGTRITVTGFGAQYTVTDIDGDKLCRARKAD